MRTIKSHIQPRASAMYRRSIELATSTPTGMSKRLTKYILIALVASCAVLMVLGSQRGDIFSSVIPEKPSAKAPSDPAPQNADEDLEKSGAAAPATPPDSKNRYTRTTTGAETKDYVKDVFIRSDPGEVLDSSTVLIAALLANKDAFGDQRTITDFVESLLAYNYDPNAISLAFLCGTQDLYDTMLPYVRDWLATTSPAYSKVTLIRAPFLDSDFKASDHAPSKQKARRRLIARARNFVLLNSLGDEEFTLFLDADIVQMADNDFIHRFVKSGKDIIVPRVQKGGSEDYDKNTWRGQRQVPSAKELELMDNNQWSKFKFIPMDVPGKMYHLEDHVKTLKHKGIDPALRELDYSVELDSVGGAVLFVRSIIFKQGVIFPPTYIVGTTWERQEGYDGIETEGLCYVAKVLGYKCWAMPNIVAYHAN